MQSLQPRSSLPGTSVRDPLCICVFLTFRKPLTVSNSLCYLTVCSPLALMVKSGDLSGIGMQVERVLFTWMVLNLPLFLSKGVSTKDQSYHQPFSAL